MRGTTRRTFLRRTGLAAGGLALVGLEAACAPAAGPTSTAGASAPVTGAALEALEAKAKAEGKMMFYGIGAEFGQITADGFKKAYPWATVDLFAAPGADLANKLIAETQAGVSSCDVVLHPPAVRANYIKNKVLAATPDFPNWALVPKVFADPQSISLAAYQNPVVLMYNSKLITTQPFTDLIELANPKYKGMIAFERPQALGLAASVLASHRKQWGDAKWEQWLRGVAANNVLITANSTAAYQAVLTGERAICIDGVNDVLAQAADAPVKALFYDGITPLPVYLSRAIKSPHPAMAALFLNWMISDAGQKVLADSKRIPIRDLEVPTAIGKVLPKGNDSQIAVTDLQSLWETPDTYLPLFNSLWPA